MICGAEGEVSRGGKGHPYSCKVTLPYVTDSISTSSSSGEAESARSMARTSSTPSFRVTLDLVFRSGKSGVEPTWIGVDNDAAGCHGVVLNKLY